MAKCLHSSKVLTISIAPADFSFQWCSGKRDLNGATSKLSSSLALTSSKAWISFDISRSSFSHL